MEGRFGCTRVYEIGVILMICNRCMREKGDEFYPKSKDRLDGPRKICMECMRSKQNSRYRPEKRKRDRGDYDYDDSR